MIGLRQRRRKFSCLLVMLFGFIAALLYIHNILLEQRLLHEVFHSAPENPLHRYSRRQLLNIFNTGNNPCSIPSPLVSEAIIPPPIYFATYPGSGSRITRNLLKAMTGGHRVHDESELTSSRRTANVIIVQTRFPHKAGKLVPWDDEVLKGIILIRHPMHAFTSLFDELYARKKHLPIRFQNGERRYRDGGPSIQDWISWRDRMFDTQLVQYGEFVRYWMKRYKDDERVVISYEDLVDEKGEGGEKEVVRLAQFLRRIRDMNVIDLKDASCVWRTVVLNNDDENGERSDSLEESVSVGQRRRRQLSSYIIPHPSSAGAELALRPFTVEQLRAMVTMLQELAFEFQNNVLLYGKLVYYHRDLMDLAKYMTMLESNQQQHVVKETNEQPPPPIPSSDNNPATIRDYHQQFSSNIGSIALSVKTPKPGTTLDGRAFHIFTSSPPRSNSVFLTNWMMGLLGSDATADYVKLITDPSLDILQNGRSVPIETTAVTHTNEIDLVSMYRIFKPSFDEVFFLVSSASDSEVCEYSNVLCIKYEEQLFTNDEHLTFLVQSLTQRFQQEFAYFFGPPENLSINLDTELAVARLHDMAVVEKAMEMDSYETIHPKYGVRGKRKRSADDVDVSSMNSVIGNIPRRLFYCGSYVTADNRRDSIMGIILVNSFLPEIQGCVPRNDDCSDVAIRLTQDTLAGSTSNDFLVYQMHQYCDVDVLLFPGMQLHVNSEYYDLHPRHGLNVNGRYTFDYLPPKENVFVMGAHEDGPRSIRLPYMFMKWWTFSKGSKGEAFQPNFDSLFVPSARPKNTKRHFLLYADSHYVNYREKAANAVSSIAPIHALGKCEGNVDAVPYVMDTKPPECIPFNDNSRPPSVIIADWNISDKFLNKRVSSEFRFVIAMENVKSPGYITEKILDAFMAGSIPVYYGTSEIFDIFNPKAFIFYDIEKPQQALDRIAYLESNPDSYEKMLNEPILAHGDKTIAKYFSFDDSIGNGVFKRKVREKLGFPV